jgi:Zn-dependent peptidase ImmA (M78 family)/transcriptional regulator with XRE-family HTH domain
MLVLARESNEWKQLDLARLVGVQQGTISKLESGMLNPSDDLIATLARVLRFPVEFFYQSDRVYGFNSTVFFHRKRHSLSDAVLRRLHANMNVARMRIVRLLRSVQMEGHNKFRAIDVSEYAGGATGVAKMVRSAWLLPPGPVKNVVDAIERAGGIVLKLDFGTRMADAVSEWIPPFPPIFLVNASSDVSGDRLRLTLAHEIGHIFLHSDRVPSAAMEHEANEFAAEFLMPGREIKSSLFGLNVAKLMDLKRLWKVSMAALIQRAFELKTITGSQRKYLIINVVRKTGTKLHEPLEAEMPKEEPSLFQRIIKIHLNELDYTPQELAKVLFFPDENEFRGAFLGERRLTVVRNE